MWKFNFNETISFLDGESNTSALVCSTLDVDATSSTRFVTSVSSLNDQRQSVWTVSSTGTITKRFTGILSPRPTDIANAKVSSGQIAVASRVNSNLRVNAWNLSSSHGITNVASNGAGFVYQLKVATLFSNFSNSRIVTVMVDSDKKLRSIIWDFELPLGKLGETGEVTENTEESDLFENYPNPVSESTTFSFTLQQASNVQLKVLNQLGAVVAVVYSGGLAEGKHELTWDTQNLQSGIYWSVLETGDNRKVNKIVISK